MYFRKTCFFPRWSFVSFRIWQNVWGCVQDWNMSSWKGTTAGKVKLSLEERCKGEWVIVSHEYIWLIFVMWSAPNARDKIKVPDVVGSINQVIFLINIFSKLISFTDIHHLCFGNKWISILFSRIFLYQGHYKNIGVYILQVSSVHYNRYKFPESP